MANQFKKLPRSLIFHISRFLTNINPNEKKYMFQLPNISVILPIVMTFRETSDYYRETIEQLKLQHYLRIYSKQYYDVLLLAYKICAIYREDFKFPSQVIKYNLMSCLKINDLHEAGIIITVNGIETKFIFLHAIMCTHWIPVDKIEFTNGDTLLFTNSKRTIFAGGPGNEIICIRKDSFPHLNERNIEIRQWEGNIYVQSNLQINEFKEFINKKENRIVFKIE